MFFFTPGCFMERYFVFLLIHDDFAKEEDCKCHTDVIPVLQSLLGNIYERCIKDKLAYGGLENSQYVRFDPLLALKDVMPKIYFSLVADRIDHLTEWHEGEHLEELSIILEKKDDGDQNKMADETCSDKDSEISEKLHQLADDLPHHAGVPLEIFWFLCGKDKMSIRSHLNLYGALKRFQQWHNASITVICGSDYDRNSFSKTWQMSLHLSVIQLNGKEAIREVFNPSVVWHGSLIFNEDQSKITLPGFKLCNRRGQENIKPNFKRILNNSIVIDNVDLCIGPEIIIFCKVEKSTVPFHLFVPVKLGLSIACPSLKCSARLVQWLSLENKKNIALIGSIKLTVSSAKISKEKNTEAWYKFVQGQSCSGISDAKTDDDVDYDRRICLICSESDEKLALFFLRAPEHLNGKLYHDLTMILSSFLISQDQEVGGPLKFPDLTDSFLETQKNLSEVLLCKLQQELGGRTDNPCQVHPPDILNQLAEAKWKLLQEERKQLLQEGKEIELEVVRRETLLHSKPVPMSPSKWPERIWLMRNDPDSKVNKVAGSDETKYSSEVSTLSVQDILEKFRLNGMPVTRNLCPLRPLEGGLVDKHVQVNNAKSVENIKGEDYPEALSASYHGIEYCLDDRRSLAKDSQLSLLQSSHVKLETFSSYVSRDKQAERRLYTRSLNKGTKNINQKHNLMKLTVPLNRTKLMATTTVKTALARRPLVKRKSPLKQNLPVPVKRKREESVEETKHGGAKEDTKKETRSERHKRRLRQVVQKTLKDNGIDSNHTFYQACTDRLYLLCKSFLKDLRSSHGLNDEMKRLAKSNVHQVIEFETKRTSASEKT